jgi:hypothetical protein|tara:strand:+ start:8881 stop:9207 length:327 start_codon:yes stop_codon:yes gene_type:complete
MALVKSVLEADMNKAFTDAMKEFILQSQTTANDGESVFETAVKEAAGVFAPLAAAAIDDYLKTATITTTVTTTGVANTITASAVGPGTGVGPTTSSGSGTGAPGVGIT